MNRLSPYIIILLLASIITGSVCILYAHFFPAITTQPGYTFYIAIGATFMILLAGLYFLAELYFFQRSRKIASLIRKYRKNFLPSLPDITFSSNALEDLGQEVDDWAEDQSQELEQRKKLENYRKEFLGNVSHELKTPIFNIQGYLHTLLDGALNDPQINTSFLQRADKSVDRMINIIEDLEAISQLETGGLQLEPERFDIIALAKDVFESQELKATNKGIILSFRETDENRPLYIIADRFRIRQVLTNLVVNSIKYGKEFGETDICCQVKDDLIWVEIRDNGIGISEEHLPRLFERFYRVDKSRSREMGGTGLGLAIVKHILEAHQQTISVSSSVGNGSSFVFTVKKG
jgi:two-component system, OmpR family, phosphate regulon sensor histidine kinase PhoR